MSGLARPRSFSDARFLLSGDTTVGACLAREKDELTPSDQLGLTILAEAMGGTESEVHQTILHAWRLHLEVVSDLRKVEEITGEEPATPAS